jgi:hypothetical protein
MSWYGVKQAANDVSLRCFARELFVPWLERLDFPFRGSRTVNALPHFHAKTNLSASKMSARAT